MCEDQHHALVIEIHKFDAGRFPGEVRHRQIKIAVRQPLLNLIVAALNEFNDDIRAVTLHRLHNRRHDRPATRVGNTHAQHAGPIAGDVAHFLAKCIAIAAESLRISREHRAGIGQFERHMAYEKRASELPL